MQPDKERLDSYLQALAENDKLMLSVAVSQHGQLIYQSQQGMASFADSKPHGANTVFRIGSVTKAFTAVLIMQLVEDGKLSLDSKLAEYFPQVPNAEQISIKHLLCHRSGIYNFTSAPEYAQYMTDAKSRAQMVEIISQFEPVFEPGSQFAYSNSNYVLLGMIIEKLYGDDYAVALTNKITAPLGLRHTKYGTDIRPDHNEAHSFRFEGGEWKEMPQTHLSIPHGAGAMVSTPRELTVFFQSLFEHKLLSADSLAQMLAFEDGYGFGLFKLPFKNIQGAGHNGGIDGFVAYAGYLAEDGLAFAVTSNGVNADFDKVVLNLLSGVFGWPFEIPDFSVKALRLPLDELQPLAGFYSSDDHPLNIEIILSGEQLLAQATGQGAFPLTPNSNTEFCFEPAGIVFRFDEDSSSEFELEQSGRKFRFAQTEKVV